MRVDIRLRGFNMIEGQSSGILNLAQHKAGMHVGYTVDAGDLVQQKFLVVLHVRHYDLNLVVS